MYCESCQQAEHEEEIMEQDDAIYETVAQADTGDDPDRAYRQWMRGRMTSLLLGYVHGDPTEVRAVRDLWRSLLSYPVSSSLYQWTEEGMPEDHDDASYPSVRAQASHDALCLLAVHVLAKPGNAGMLIGMTNGTRYWENSYATNVGRMIRSKKTGEKLARQRLDGLARGNMLDGKLLSKLMGMNGLGADYAMLASDLVRLRTGGDLKMEVLRRWGENIECIIHAPYGVEKSEHEAILHDMEQSMRQQKEMWR
jgi:hypothetical protein